MNENENNFESLRRLLALKRHETPPPGYFENFSADVMARIRAGESGAEARTVELPWLFRLLASFEAKPAFAGAFASGLCMLLLVGIVYAERPDVAMQPSLLQTSQINSPLAAVTPISMPPLPPEQPALASISSTNPVFNSQPAVTQSAAMIFGQSSATVQPLTFSMGN